VSAQSSTGFFARLGCTRIGSPGIFGVQNTKALFMAVKPQVAGERMGVSYRASFGCGFRSERPCRRRIFADGPRRLLGEAMGAAGSREQAGFRRGLSLKAALGTHVSHSAGPRAAALGSRNGLRMELRPAASAHRDQADGQPMWQVLLSGMGLSAGLDVSEASWEPCSLTDLVGDLAQDWRGWDGDRSWQSEEAELRLTARHDKSNTVLVRVEIEDGAPPRWRCEAELELDPDAFEQLAGDLRELSRPSIA
jgi:hypothetical protein